MRKTNGTTRTTKRGVESYPEIKKEMYSKKMKQYADKKTKINGKEIEGRKKIRRRKVTDIFAELQKIECRIAKSRNL